MKPTPIDTVPRRNAVALPLDSVKTRWPAPKPETPSEPVAPELPVQPDQPVVVKPPKPDSSLLRR